MFLAVVTTLLAVVGVLALLPNLAVTQLFTDRPPQGERAMGLIVLFALAAAGGVLLLLATITAAGTGGLNWAGRSPGLGVLVFVLLSIGIAIGAVVCLINWCEPGGWPVFAIGVVSGLVGPALLAGVLIASVFAAPGAFASPGLRAGLLAALTVCALTGYAVAGRWTLLGLRQSADNTRRTLEADAARDAEWERKRNRTPMEAAKEDFAEIGDASPLWCVVTYLPNSDEPAYQQFVIARCLNVPDFENELARTITSSHAVYRHPCVDLVRLAPDHAVTPAWQENVGRSIDVTADELRQQPDWLTDTTNNPKPLEHVRSLVAAAKRVAPNGELNGRLEHLREAVVNQPPSESREAALKSFS